VYREFTISDSSEDARSSTITTCLGNLGYLEIRCLVKLGNLKQLIYRGRDATLVLPHSTVGRLPSSPSDKAVVPDLKANHSWHVKFSRKLLQPEALHKF
jgi:hypothetical protein